MQRIPFQRFIDAHRDVVWRFLVASVGRHEADDCFQETFLAALRAYPRLRSDESGQAWVLTIAHRKAIDAHRARARRPVPTADEVLAAERDARDAAPASADGGHPELWGAVRDLPAKQRAAIVLRFVADLSHGEAAEIIGCSEEASRASTAAALSRLRKEWAHD